jgi:hypothetical protein
LYLSQTNADARVSPLFSILVRLGVATLPLRTLPSNVLELRLANLHGGHASGRSIIAATQWWSRGLLDIVMDEHSKGYPRLGKGLMEDEDAGLLSLKMQARSSINLRRIGWWLDYFTVKAP